MSTLPHNQDIEKYILGGILLDNELILQILDVVNSSDFFVPAHKPIYQAMEYLAENSTDINHITIPEALKTLGLYNSNSLKDLADIITGLATGVPKTTDLSFYVETLKKLSIERKKLNLTTNLQTAILDGDRDKVTKLEDEFAELSIPSNAGGLELISTVSDEAFKELYKKSVIGKAVTGLATGIEQFDNSTSGLQDGEVMIIAARTSVGKTAFAINAAQYAAVTNNKTVAIFSLEMSKSSLFMRMLASQARVALHKLKTGNLSYTEWARLLHAQDVLTKAKILIDDSSAMTPRKLKTSLKKAKIKHGQIDLVVIDYLQLMSMGFNIENRQQEVSQISRYIKILADEFELPVMALSQLSRAPEQRNNTKHTPLVSDLRESGSLEQDADIVALLYREEMYDPTDENEGITSLIVGKHRNGALEKIPLFYVKEQVRFENIFIS